MNLIRVRVSVVTVVRGRWVNVRLERGQTGEKPANMHGKHTKTRKIGACGGPASKAPTQWGPPGGGGLRRRLRRGVQVCARVRKLADLEADNCKACTATAVTPPAPPAPPPAHRCVRVIEKPARQQQRAFSHQHPSRQQPGAANLKTAIAPLHVCLHHAGGPRWSAPRPRSRLVRHASYATRYRRR
jgi:hypothetical protein